MVRSSEVGGSRRRLMAEVAQVVGSRAAEFVGEMPRGESRTTFMVVAGTEKLIVKLAPGGLSALENQQRLVRLVGGLRSRGYPAPEYLGAGEAEGMAFTVQRVVSGETLEPSAGLPPEQDLFAQILPELLAAVELQAGAGDLAEPPWPEWLLATIETGGDGYCLHATMRQAEDTAFLLARLQELARRNCDRQARRADVVHFSNAGSLFLPGSNLTNLMVVGHLRLSGREFLGRMWVSALAVLFITALVIVAFEHRSLRVTTEDPTRPERPVLRPGLAAIVAATVLVVVLRSPALLVAAVGVVAIGTRLAIGREGPRHVLEVLGLPTLMGLFGVAVALGILGRLWSRQAALLSHVDMWGTAVNGAVSAMLVNNLPAASLSPPGPQTTPSHYLLDSTSGRICS